MGDRSIACGWDTSTGRTGLVPPLVLRVDRGVAPGDHHGHGGADDRAQHHAHRPGGCVPPLAEYHHTGFALLVAVAASRANPVWKADRIHRRMVAELTLVRGTTSATAHC
ncbi:hypothetical protein [Saccharopolyspora thermophila]|uniref:hypothetical protein n=1 Tax=Saccharopolyspora thermophila TaxID=89367 RepID=UPI00166D917D|nr:hypothetical protein [Saccharopolyspora subtropica]